MSSRLRSDVGAALFVGLAFQAAFGCASFTEAAPDHPAPTPVDASVTESGPAVVDGGAFSCADHDGAALCDEFERSDVQGPWSQLTSPAGGGSLSIEDSVPASGNRRLRVFIPAALESSGQALRYVVPSNTTHVEMSFLMRFDALPGKQGAVNGDDAQLVALQTSDGSSNLFLMASAQYGVRLAEQGGTFSSMPLGTPPLGVFVRYVLKIDLAGATATATMETGTSAPAIQSLTLSFAGPKTMSLGNIYAAPQEAPRNVWFDDVVLTLR